MQYRVLPCAAACVGSAAQTNCPMNTAVDMYKDWKHQYQKNFAVVPSLSKPTMKKKMTVKMTDEAMRYGI